MAALARQDRPEVSAHQLRFASEASLNAISSDRKLMYHNPSASQWRAENQLNQSVLAFHRTLPSYAHTPLLEISGPLADTVGLHRIFLKDESNRFGLPAFKILGASWASYRAVLKHLDIPPDTPIEAIKHAARGNNVSLYASTEGNFGRAVARMATLLGVTACIYVPTIMVEDTQALIKGEGAEVVKVDDNYDSTVHKAAEDAAAIEGAILVQDDAWEGYEEVPAWVVEGYSTMLTEIDEQLHAAGCDGPDLVVVPVGVGSLAQATVSHFKAKGKEKVPRVLAVEPESAACLKNSLKAGKSVTIETGETNMCGMNCGTVSSLAWPVLRDGVDASLTVSEAEADDASNMFEQIGVRTGPCSSGTLAALLKACRDARDALHWDSRSCVVLFGTEGLR